MTSLEQKVASGISYEEAYAQSMGKASAAAKQQAISTKGAAGTTDTFVAKQKKAQAALEATATSSRVAAIGVKALKTAFNMFSGLIISFAISKIVEGLQYLTESAERAKEKLEEIRTDLSDSKSSYENNRKTLEGLRDEYDSLTDKADKLGGVQNLTNEEYKRYTEIMSQILGITPKLITGWDDEGNAISNKNGLLQQSIDLLDEEYEKSIRNNTTKSKNEEVATGVITELDEFENSGDTKTASGTKYDLVWKDLKDYVDEAVAKGINYTYKSTGVTGHNSADIAYAINEFVYGDSLYESTELNTVYGWLGSLQERITSSEENLKQFSESLKDTENPIYQWFTDEQIDQLIQDSNAYFQELDRIQSDRETYYQKYKDQLNWNAQAATDGSGKNAYKQLSDESKSAISEYIDNLDYASIKTADDFVDMTNDIKSFTKTLASDNTFADYINDIYTPQDDDESISEYSKRVEDAINNVQKYINDNNLSISLDFGTDDDPNGIKESVNKLQEKYDDAINRFKTDEESKLEELKQSYQEVIDKRKELYSGTNYVGNVDINNRPVVINGDGSYSTTSTSFQEKWVGDEENGHYIIAHFTPILPDGTVLDEDSLNEYIDNILNSADPMEADKVENGGKGIVYKVDTEINGKDITDANLEDAFGVADAWDIDMHNLQDKMYRDEAAIKAQIARFGDDVDGSQKIKDFFDTEGINTTEEIDAFNEVTKGINDADKAIRAWIEHKREANENHLSFTEYMDNLEKSLSSGFDQLDKIYADVLNKEDFDWSSILNNSSFTEAFGNMENVTSEYKNVYDDFIETISNSPDDIGKCQQAFNDLATAYIQNSGALDDLSESTKQSTINRLEEMGISNAEEIVTNLLTQKQAELAAQKYYTANASDDLKDATIDEYLEFVTEADVTDETKRALAELALQKISTNNVKIETSDDIDQIIALANAAGASAIQLAKLAEAKAIIEKYNTVGLNGTTADLRKYEEAQALIKSIEEGTYKVDNALDASMFKATYNGGKSSKAAADSAKKSADDLYNTLKSQIEAYLDFMEKSLEAGRIDYNTYCHDVKKYLDDLYNSGKLKAADYFSYVERSLTKQKEIYDKVISAITDRLQEEIDKIDEQIDAINKQNDALNEQKDNYDKILSVVSDVYDKQIDELNKQKDALQDQINALDDQNDALDLQYRKEQALYNLRKAQEQRTKKLYIEGAGYVYRQDGEAIRDAQKELSDIQTEEIKKKLQDEQDALDKTIAELEKYKALWAEIPDLLEKQQNQQLATSLWGKEYESLILQNRTADIEDFKNNYLNAQTKINNNEELIKSFEEKKTYYSKLKDQWSALSGEYEKQQNRMYAAEVMGADWESQILSGRTDVLTKFGNDYFSIQDAITQAQWNATNERIKAYQAEADAATAAANAITAAYEAAKNKEYIDSPNVGSANYNPGTSSAGMPTNANGGDGGNRYAAATADQRKNNTNLIMSNEQKMTIAASKNSFTGSSSDTRKLLHNIRAYASGGVVKVNPNDVFFKDTAKQIGEDTIAFVKDGERVLTPVQNKWWEEWTDSIPQMFSLLDNIPHDAFTGMNDLVRNLSENNVTKTVSNNQPVTISIGDIHLHDVQNPDQLADAIIKYMPGTMKQKLSKSGR